MILAQVSSGQRSEVLCKSSATSLPRCPTLPSVTGLLWGPRPTGSSPETMTSGGAGLKTGQFWAKSTPSHFFFTLFTTTCAEQSLLQIDLVRTVLAAEINVTPGDPSLAAVLKAELTVVAMAASCLAHLGELPESVPASPHVPGQSAF